MSNYPIWHDKKKNFSKRMALGKIDVIKKHCPCCGHNKAFAKPKGIFCTRCGQEI